MLDKNSKNIKLIYILIIIEFRDKILNKFKYFYLLSTKLAIE